MSQLSALIPADQETFARRRRQLMQQLPKGIALIPSGSLETRSHDTEFPFRVSSNYFYLTGHSAPNCLLVLDNRDQQEYLLVPKRHPDMELWTGEMMGPERVQAFLGIAIAKPMEEVGPFLEQLFKNAPHVCTDLHDERLSYLGEVQKQIKKLYATRKPNFSTPTTLVHLPPFIERMRLKKSEEEIDWLQKSNHIAQQAHRLAMRTARPGLHEYHLHADIEWVFKFMGSPSAAYGVIVATGNNTNTLHYISNRHLLKSGELVLIDAGCEWMHMASDITRTFPVNGRFSSPQRDLYNVVLKAQEKAFAKATSGATLPECHQATCHELTRGLHALGILKGHLDDLIEKEAWKPFYPHGTSHWLGLDVHDQCPYKDEHLKDLNLVQGMCFTVEPGLYCPSQNSNIDDHWKGIGIRIEDDVVVRADKTLLNLTQDLPKSIADIEQECQSDPMELIRSLRQD